MKQIRDSSIRREIEGSPIFNDDQVLGIIREFGSDEARLAALRQLARIQKASQESADKVYSKIRPTIDVAEKKTSANRKVKSGSLIIFIFLFTIAALGVLYALVANDAVRTDFINAYKDQLNKIGSAIGIPVKLEISTGKRVEGSISIIDAFYLSRWQPHRRCPMNSFMRYECEGKAYCDYGCNDFNSSCGDVDKGAAKHCIVKYTCNKGPSDIRFTDVWESGNGKYRISCDSTE